MINQCGPINKLGGRTGRPFIIAAAAALLAVAAFAVNRGDDASRINGAPHDEAQEAPPEIGGGVLKTEIDSKIQDILEAHDLPDARRKSRALFEAVGVGGLPALKRHQHESIALRAAWQEVLLTVPTMGPIYSGSLVAPTDRRSRARFCVHGRLERSACSSAQTPGTVEVRRLSAVRGAGCSTHEPGDSAMPAVTFHDPHQNRNGLPGPFGAGRETARLRSCLQID